MMTKEKKVAVITGTSSGFGLLTSVELAKAGYTVVATMRNVGKKSQLLELAEVSGILERIHVKKLDVTDEETVPSVFNNIIDEFGQVDLLINNAGYAKGGLIEEVPLGEWRAQFETNFFGVVACTKAVLPYMRKKSSGTIINISSISGVIGLPGMGPYNASKFAVEGFSEALRLEMKRFGVKVILVEPGSFKTNVWEKGLSDLALDTEPDYMELNKKLVKMASHSAENAGDPMDVVKVILEVISSPKPKLRYPVGRGMKLAVAVKNWLPWRTFEKNLTKRL